MAREILAAVGRLLLLFVDGVGLAPESAANPLATEPTPALRALLGGPLTRERVGERDGALLAALDATLGVDGLPQSATGQTALFTGVNAAAAIGRHVAAFPGPRLAALLAERSLLRRARAAGRASTFANPFPPRYFEEVAARRRRHAATTLAALAGGGRLRGLAELAAGRACTWDVTRDRFAEYEPTVAPIAAAEAGRQLARLAAEHDLTLWETFATDLAGHRRRGMTAGDALARLDGLLAGVVEEIAASGLDELTVLLASDHGNLEESGHTAHTRNPVPLLAFGPGRARFAGLGSIVELTPAILAALGVETA
jgi:hypothetical protein